MRADWNACDVPTMLETAKQFVYMMDIRGPSWQQQRQS
jgi:hypothetical protein